MQLSTKTQHQQGFTLIELSIVLVIIGLIVGGVLVGQDLIKAAQIRASITQIDAYDSAVNTFRGKYNGLPGDLTNCTNFFAATDCTTATGKNGDNQLEDFSGTNVLFSGEVAQFFHNLYNANLIGDAITDTTNISANGAAVVASAMPAAKIGGGNRLMAYTGGAALVEPGMAGTNVYRIAGVSGVAAGVPTFVNDLTPLQAYGIDAKKDDGIPNTGVVQATDQTAGASFNLAADTTIVGAGKCVAVAGVYDTATATGNTPLCQIIVRGSF